MDVAVVYEIHVGASERSLFWPTFIFIPELSSKADKVMLPVGKCVASTLMEVPVGIFVSRVNAAESEDAVLFAASLSLTFTLILVLVLKALPI